MEKSKLRCECNKVVLIKEDEQSLFQIFYCHMCNMFIDGDGYPVEFKEKAFQVNIK